VIHSIEFGTEPIGDGDDGDNFVNDLISFRSQVRPYGIPVGISEDWDRPGTMSGTNDVGLGSTGKQILANSDLVHAHIMPYYHNNLDESGAWAYITAQVAWYKKNINVPTLISEVLTSQLQIVNQKHRLMISIDSVGLGRKRWPCWR